MNTQQINEKIGNLQAELKREIEKYGAAIDHNSGGEVRKEIRKEMLRIGGEILALKKKLKEEQEN